MKLKDVFWKTVMWRFIKMRLGYDKQEMALFKSNPRNRELVFKAPDVMGQHIVAYVVASKGCNSRHKVGDKIVFDGFGNLVTELSPKRICLYALNAITPQVFAAGELYYANVDPNTMRFNRAACFDGGLECGGVGRIVMEIRMEPVGM